MVRQCHMYEKTLTLLKEVCYTVFIHNDCIVLFSYLEKCLWRELSEVSFAFEDEISKKAENFIRYINWCSLALRNNKFDYKKLIRCLRTSQSNYNQRGIFCNQNSINQSFKISSNRNEIKNRIVVRYLSELRL